MYKETPQRGVSLLLRDKVLFRVSNAYLRFKMRKLRQMFFVLGQHLVDHCLNLG